MSNSQYEAGGGLSLADVDRELANNGSLSATRRRDLRSAISRVAALVGEDPGRLPLDLAIIACEARRHQSDRRRADAEDAEQHPLRPLGRRAGERAAAGASVQGGLVAAVGRPAGKATEQARAHRPLAARSLCQCRRPHARRDR